MAKSLWLRELRRRHVFRVAAAYAVVGWLLIQVVTQVFPIFHFPDWIDQAVVLLILVGFPIALVLAWAFDATPHGIVRTDASPDGGDAGTRSPGRSRRAGLAVGLVGVLIASVAGGIYWQSGRPAPSPAEIARVARSNNAAVCENAPCARAAAVCRSGPCPRAAAEMQARSSTLPAPAQAAPAQPIPAKSIAVPPFENLSTDKGNAYFADGMQDLILTKLADVGDLKVISRTSTEQYASHPEDLRIIGQQLGVATILEGSVQKAGEQVLINVQLIDVLSGSHIWAQSYQRNLDNIFGVEGEVAQKVTEALNAKLSAVEQQALAGRLTENPAAYDAYLRGLAFEKKASSGNDSLPMESDALRQAETLYGEAVEFDPKFAMAWAHLGYVKVLVYNRFIDRSPAFLAQAKQAIDTSLQLQPDLGQGYLVLAQYYYLGLRDLDAAVPPLQQARKLLPNNADVLVALSDVEERQGKWRNANAHLRQAALLEPRSAVWLTDLSYNFTGMREFPQARAMLDRALRLDPGDRDLIMDEASTWQEQGNLKAAQKLLDEVPVSVAPGDDIFIRWQQFMDRRDYTGAVAAMQSFITNPDNGGLNRIAGRSFLARALELAGRKDEARALATQVVAELEGERKSPADDIELAYYLSQTYAVLGDKSDALREAQRDVQMHATCSVCEPYAISQLAQLQARFGEADAAIAVIPYLMEVPNGITVSDLRLDPGWDPLRNDPRFEALLKKYSGHPPATATSVPVPAVVTDAVGPSRD